MAGYQVIYPSVQITANNGNSVQRTYQPTSHELRHIERLNQIEQLKAKERVTKQDLQAKEIQIEALELQRLKEGLEDKLLQQELMVLFLEQQAILLVRMELERLIQELIDEDEAILVILMTTTL